MSETREIQELEGRQSRAGYAHPGAWMPTILGCACAAAGAFVLAVAMEWIPVDPSDVHAPMWVIGAIGGSFFIAGLALAWMGILGLRTHRARRRRLAGRPDAPWLADFEWDPDGAETHPVLEVSRHLTVTLFLALFLVPFHWWAFISDEGSWMVRVVVCVFDLILILVAGQTVYVLLRSLKYGSARFRFSRFPFRVGEPLDGFLALPRRLQGANRITLTLTCLREEARVVRNSKGHNQTANVIQRIYENEQKLDLSRMAPHVYAAQLPVHIEIPPDLPGTKLSDMQPVYWELKASAATPGVDYEAVFLLPIYR